jgi:putative PEP-CTERM system TPR-repeat lipoprotein
MFAIRRWCRILPVLALLVPGLPPAYAADSAEKASGYYEDALLRMERNDTKGAIVQLKNALQQDARMLPALVLLGRAYLKDGAPLGAERVLADAERLGAGRSEIIAMQAEVYNLLGRNDELLERFSPEGLPPEVKYKVLVTRAYAQMDLGKESAAIQSLEQARQIDPGKVAAQVAQSMAYLRMGRLGDASATVERALAQNPQDPSVWNMKGSIAHAQGDAKGALAGYTKALDVQPDYLDALIARASLLLDLNRDREAEPDIAVLKREFPDEPRSTYLYALLAQRQGKPAAEVRAALVAATSALDALPFAAVATRPQFLLLGGVSHFSLGQNEKAKTYLAAYLKKNPEHMGARKIYTAILMNEKEYARAIAFLEGPARARPNDPQALSMLASAYMALGRHEMATSLLEQASTLAGGDAPDIGTHFGLSLIGSGQVDLGTSQLEKAYAQEPGSARSGVPLALMQLKKGEAGGAIRTLQAVLKKDPANLTALNILGIAQGLAGDRAGARKTYEQVLAKSARFTPARLNLARLDLADGKPDAARQRLLALIKEQPKNLDAHFELAQVELYAQRPQDAIRWLEKARSFNPQSLRPSLMLVDLYLATGDTKKALDTAKDVQAGNRDNLQALAALGRVHLATGNSGLARENFRRITQLAGFDVGWLLRVAALQRSAADFDGARYSLDKALTSEPGHFSALLMKAELDVASGNLDAAEQQARRLAAQYPREAGPSRVLGDVAMRRQRYADAVTAYRAAYKLKKSSEHAIGLYWAYRAAGDTAAALAAIRSWAGGNPADLEAQRVLAQAYIDSGQLALAQQQLDALGRKLPRDAGVWNDLAYVLYKQGKPGALEIAARAYELAPSDANVADTYGWLLVESGQVDKGLRYLREAQIRAPNDPEIGAHLAEALRRKGAGKR